MALRKIRNTYYVYFRDIDGKLKTRSLKTTDAGIAKNLHDIYMRQLQAKKGRLMILRDFPEYQKEADSPITTVAPPVAAENPGGKRLKLADMVAVARQYRNIHPRYEREFARFVEKMKPLRYADQITPEIALKYLEDNFSGGNGKGYNNTKSTLNTIFRCCAVQAGIERSPFASIINKLVRDVEHHRPITQEEFVAAFAAAEEPWKTASLISWHTALRRETCFRLSWKDIDQKDRSITIVPGKTARFGRAVYIPIHPELWDWLCSLPRPAQDDKPILSQFPKRNKWSKTENCTYYVGLLRSLGIRDTAEGKASFHSLRASFITRCDEAGITRRATKGVVGQIDDRITDLYSHDRETAKQILRLPAADVCAIVCNVDNFREK